MDLLAMFLIELDEIVHNEGSNELYLVILLLLNHLRQSHH